MADSNEVLSTKIDNLGDRFTKLNEIVTETEKKAEGADACCKTLREKVNNTETSFQDKVKNMETLFQTELKHAVETLGSKIEAIGSRQKEVSERRWKIITMVLSALIGLAATGLGLYLGLK